MSLPISNQIISSSVARCDQLRAGRDQRNPPRGERGIIGRIKRLLLLFVVIELAPFILLSLPPQQSRERMNIARFLTSSLLAPATSRVKAYFTIFSFSLSLSPLFNPDFRQATKEGKKKGSKPGKCARPLFEGEKGNNSTLSFSRSTKKLFLLSLLSMPGKEFVAPEIGKTITFYF